MPTAIQYIQTRAPSYVTDPNLTALIEQATLETGDVFGSTDMRNKAIALLVCHWIALGKRDGSGVGITGNISSEAEGDLSRGFGMQGVSTAVDRDLGQTSWGLELIRFRRSRIMNPMTRLM